MSPGCGRARAATLRIASVADGRWEPMPAAPYATTTAHCDLYGKMIMGQLWCARHGGRTLALCERRCQRTWLEYWLPRPGPKRCPGASKIRHACVIDSARTVRDTHGMNVPSLYGRLGTTIKARRHQLGVTQQRLAFLLGISRASLANIETGRQRMLVHQLYRFADVLELRLEDLLPKSEEIKELEVFDNLRFSENVTLEERRQLVRLLHQKHEVVPSGVGER